MYYNYNFYFEIMLSHHARCQFCLERQDQQRVLAVCWGYCQFWIQKIRHYNFHLPCSRAYYLFLFMHISLDFHHDYMKFMERFRRYLNFFLILYSHQGVIINDIHWLKEYNVNAFSSAVVSHHSTKYKHV